MYYAVIVKRINSFIHWWIYIALYYKLFISKALRWPWYLLNNKPHLRIKQCLKHIALLENTRTLDYTYRLYTMCVSHFFIMCMPIHFVICLLNEYWLIDCVTIWSYILPATHTRTIPASSPLPQCVTAIWLVLIAPTHEEMARLGWPGWLVTYRDKCAAPGIEPGHGHPSQY